ncbi:MAG: Zn-ribbon domain-containing OB-fold protein [Nocardioidaceae bacterium]
MTTTTADVSGEPAFFEQTWDLSYRHALGTTVGGFLDGLKKKQLLGRKCPGCTRVLFPARSFCDRCHTATEDWVEVGHRGTLEMFTIVVEPFPGMRVSPPYVLAYALLDGADTAVVGYLKGIDLSDIDAAATSLRTSMPIDVAFTDEPEGQVTDFWFEPRGV